MNMLGSYGQKFKDEFCGQCMHYFYECGKKIWEEQERYCHRQGGECQRLLSAVVMETIK